MTSPEFATKLGAVDGSDLRGLASFLNLVESANNKDAILDDSMNSFSLGEEIYVYREQQTSIYFTFGGDTDDEYLLLLDITTEGPRGTVDNLFTTMNPRTNSAVNPRYNSSINPRYTSSINPRYNSSINPRYNSSINPRYNSSINPQLNSTFGGPYLYTNDLRNVGYLIKANDNVELIFELSGKFSGFLVSANEQVRVQFDTANQWVGYVVKANEEVALRYTADNEWIGTIS